MRLRQDPVHLRGALADLASVASPRVVRRGLVVASLGFVQRTLAPVLAWTLVERSLGDKLALALLFAGAYTLQTSVRRVLAARTEAELFERVASGVLDGDVLQTSILPEQDPRLEVGQAVWRGGQLLGEAVPNAFADGVASAVLGLAATAFVPARQVAFAALALALVVAAVVLSRRAVVGAQSRSWGLQEQAYEAFGDALEGRLEIVAAGARAAFLEELGRRVQAWSRATAREALVSVVSGRLAVVAAVGLVVAALLGTGQLRASLSLSLADAAVLAGISPAFFGVAQALQEVAREAQWARLLARLANPPAPRTGRAAVAPSPALPAPIAFDGVSFQYADGPEDPKPALSAVSFTWDGREILALSGANGSGKSTCLRVLLALARPQAGSVRVGGTPLASIDVEVWRQRVAFLPQRPFLPPRSTVVRAVRWPSAVADDDRIRAALGRVGLLEVLRRMGPDPLNVQVDALSVGQRQRVALARLLCRDASIFLLDEPDANLDRAGISLVADLLRELATRGMVAFSAHTPDLLEVADRVVSLDRGRVVPGSGDLALASSTHG